MRNALFPAFTLSFLLLSSLAAATQIGIAQPEDVWVGNTTVATITINNTEPAARLFSLGVTGLEGSNWLTLEKSSVSVSGASSESVKLWISPPRDATAGLYTYTVIATSGSERTESDVFVSVRQPVAYGVIDDITLSCLECTDNLHVEAVIKNTGMAPLEGKLLLAISGLRKEVGFSNLAQGSTAKLQADFGLEGVIPGDYRLTAVLTGAKGALDSRTTDFTIPKLENLNTQQSESSNPLWSSVTISATNTGNVPAVAQLRSKVSSDWWVAYIGPEPASMGETWIWAVTMQPGQTYTMTYFALVWPFPVIITAAVLSFVWFFLWSGSTSLQKSASNKGDEWSVSLMVHNRGRTVDGVVVRDIVPSGLDLTGKFETLKPITRRTPTGTELVWRVGTMRRGEQRLLHYRMHSDRTKVFNKAMLPSASLRAKKGLKTIIGHSETEEITCTDANPTVKLVVEK